MDDLLITESYKDMIDDFKIIMTKEFKMTDTGLISFFLSIEVMQDKNERKDILNTY